MVERVNGTIKNQTILAHDYLDKTEMQNDLTAFLIYYNLYRRHGSLRKELNVKTPFEAIEKWFLLKPEIFYQKPTDFKNKISSLKTMDNINFNQ